MNRKFVVVAGLLVVANIWALAVLPADAAAANTATSTAANTATQTPPGYYDGQSSSVDSGGWLSGLTDASLDDILTLSVRVGPWVIGSGHAAQGGVGSAGVLLTGALVASIVLGTGVRGRVGPVGGAVLAVATTFAFVSVGIGPGWLYAMVLFGVGAVASVLAIRVFR